MSKQVTNKRVLLESNLDSYDQERLVRVTDKYADIPFKVDLFKDKNASIYVHDGLLEEAKTTLADGLTAEEVEGLIVDVSFTLAVMRKILEDNRNIKTVTNFYKPLSSPDGIKRKILHDIESGAIEESHGNFLLMSLGDDSVVPDVSRINAVRLSTDVVVNRRKSIVSPDTVEIAGKRAIANVLDVDKPQYDAVLRAFGNESIIERNRLFAGSIQETILAFAFPMSEKESEGFIELLPIT